MWRRKRTVICWIIECSYNFILTRTFTLHIFIFSDTRDIIYYYRRKWTLRTICHRRRDWKNICAIPWCRGIHEPLRMFDLYSLIVNNWQWRNRISCTSSNRPHPKYSELRLSKIAIRLLIFSIHNFHITTMYTCTLNSYCTILFMTFQAGFVVSTEPFNGTYATIFPRNRTRPWTR